MYLRGKSIYMYISFYVLLGNLLASVGAYTVDDGYVDRDWSYHRRRSVAQYMRITESPACTHLSRPVTRFRLIRKFSPHEKNADLRSLHFWARTYLLVAAFFVLLLPFTFSTWFLLELGMEDRKFEGWTRVSSCSRFCHIKAIVGITAR